jgi:hypothetical protein
MVGAASLDLEVDSIRFQTPKLYLEEIEEFSQAS